MIRSTVIAALTALGGCCAAPTTPAPAPVVVAAPVDVTPGAPSMAQCQAILPGVGDAPADVVDAWFFAWIERFDTVEYNGSVSGWWTDGAGHLIGWSVQEDAAICAVNWPGYPAGAPTYDFTVDG